MFTQQHDPRSMEEIQEAQRQREHLMRKSREAQEGDEFFSQPVPGGEQDVSMNVPQSSPDVIKKEGESPIITTVEKPQEEF